MSRIFLLLSCLIFFSNAAFAAEENLYSVENVAVSVTGKSPSDARNLAVATARRDAFLILLTRLDLDISVADSVSNDEISDMVRLEQIDGERIAGSSYSATFNIVFAKDFVEHILGQKKSTAGASLVSKKDDESYLLIPVKIDNKQLIVWEEKNDWREAVIKTINKKNFGKKYIVPEADINNLSLLGRDNIMFVGYSELEPMLSRYSASAAFNMFFTYDEIENKVNINIYYIRKMQKKQIKLSFVNIDRLSSESLVEKVASKVVDYLNSPQFMQNQALSSNIVRIQIPVTSLSNWLAIKNKIENSNLVSQLNLESMASDRIIISVNYPNSEIDIAEAFLSIGILLNKTSENFYTIFNAK
jgi:hypothetical protein